MKKIFLVLVSLILVLGVCSCGGGAKEPELPDMTDAGKGGAGEFTAKVTLKDEWVEFCLPENHDGLSFKDMGANCLINVDRYDAPVAAYYEYDSEGETVKKTVGGYTFDYQKFNHFGIEDWRMYVIRIAFTDSPNQMEHEYYRFIYNVYAKEYDDAQVEKFMQTIRFIEE